MRSSNKNSAREKSGSAIRIDENSAARDAGIHSGAAGLLLAAWFAGYVWLFQGYFFNGEMGADYSYFLPKLLDEFLFAHINGWFEPQWFTPSFCGGFVGLPNPQSTYWSMPHLLLQLMSPTESVFTIMILFALLGGIGTYLFLQPICPGWPAYIAATLFASNGYHVARMLEGHLSHHAFMLAPLLACLLIRSDHPFRSRAFWSNASYAALLLSYMFIAGSAPIFPQILLTVIVLLTLAATLKFRSLPASLLGLALSGMISLLILGPKFLATVSFMLHNPRNQDPLPQFSTWQDALYHGLRIIVGPTRDTAQLRETLVNNTSTGLWHGFEYGLTVAPIVLIGMFVVLALLNRKKFAVTHKMSRIAFGPLILLCFFGILPFMINVDFGHGFTNFIRSLPLIGSTTNFFRWFIIPMTLIAMICGLMSRALIARTKAPALIGSSLATLCTIIVFIHYGYLIKEPIDSRPYSYSNTNIERAFIYLEHTDSHQIKTIGVRTDLARNESFLFGESAKYCYEAALGYRLQGMRDTLVPGDIHSVVANKLNMFDPSCYVYPHENACAPGARFDPQRRETMLDFARYRPLPYAVPRLHQSLTLLSNFAMLVTLLLVLQPLFTRARRLF